MTRLETVTLGRTHVDVVGSVFGLESEADAVLRVARGRTYIGYLLGVGNQALVSIESTDGVPPEVPLDQLGELEQFYFEQLGRFGPARLPARELYDVWRLARETNAQVAAVDLDDAAHTDAYVEHVSVWENIRKTGRQRKRAVKLSEQDDLERFVQGWDKVFFPTKGLRQVEEARERAMAAGIRRHAEGAKGPMLAVLPLERMRGVVAFLQD